MFILIHQSLTMTVETAARKLVQTRKSTSVDMELLQTMQVHWLLVKLDFLTVLTIGTVPNSQDPQLFMRLSREEGLNVVAGSSVAFLITISVPILGWMYI